MPRMTKTDRGFAIADFKDMYGESCSLQKSSLATEDAIWFGVTDVTPIIMASDAEKCGVKTKKTTGWVIYPMPEEVFINSRMHLSRETVAALLPTLQLFVDTGEIYGGADTE